MMALFGPNLSIFMSKTFDFLFRKKRFSLKIAVPKFFIFLKSTCLLLAIFLKLILARKKGVVYLVQNFQLLISKTFKFLFRKKGCSSKIAVPEF